MEFYRVHFLKLILTLDWNHCPVSPRIDAQSESEYAVV